VLLSCRFLNDVQSVNSFEPAAQIEFSAGDSQVLFLQLIDSSLDRADQGFSPAGRRYVPPAGTTMAVTFANIDDAKKFTRSASQPYAQDPSIWSVPILGTDGLRGTVNLSLVLTEPSRVLNARFATGAVLRVQ